MANPERGEVDYSYETTDKNGNPIQKTLTLKFSNAGRRATEDMLGMESGEIVQNLGKAGPGDRIKTGLFFGATRKHHARDFPNVFAVDEFMDEFVEAKEDAEEAAEGAALDMEFELIASLLAAYQRTDKKVLLKRYRVAAGLDEEEPSEEEVPKAQTGKTAKATPTE